MGPRLAFYLHIQQPLPRSSSRGSRRLGRSCRISRVPAQWRRHPHVIGPVLSSIDPMVRPSTDLGAAAMTQPARFDALLKSATPFLALAPMQEVTDGAFWTLMHRYGGADVYWTEYFRVQPDSTPEKRILDSIRQNTTGAPGHRADDRQRHPRAGPHRESAPAAPGRRDRSEPRVSRADRLPEVRRRRAAARARSASMRFSAPCARRWTSSSR